MAIDGGDRSNCIVFSSDAGTVESSRYFHSRRTVLEMLRDRGYDVPNSELTRSLPEFRSIFGEKPNHQSLTIRVSLLSDPSNKVLVCFMGTTDIIRKGTIRALHNEIAEKERLNRLILIVQSKMTAFARKDLDGSPFKVEILNINDLLVNITKHVLQPKYQLLTADEKQALLMKHSLEEKQLPHMLKADAIARYYGLEKGQVIKITHNGELVDSLVTYRCVV
ncbi:hypothetical protein Lal_00017696 [Lupinus albus]|uniref:Putative DNA-directed RNA polymerase n=1 Tax=Lupinus albus TaxID=3870 RepID=A0A6A5M843_LUPAL|nr:putative DNA-directed RNA polymerase [Lupinus albus]KAF1870116.1 hypothetical protein Lal_00017696 [Lupinus albus]